MIARRFRDIQARGEQITIENFVIDTIRRLIFMIVGLLQSVDDLVLQSES